MLYRLTRTNQSFEEHVALVAHFINQRPNKQAWHNFYIYLITQSVLKMKRRFRARKHERLYSDIVGLPAGDLKWKDYVPKPNHFDDSFLIALHRDVGLWALEAIMKDLEKHRSGHVSANSAREWILSELDSYQPQTASNLFPNLMRVDPKTPHILSRETYREFHRLLCLLILGYKDSTAACSYEGGGGGTTTFFSQARGL